MASNGQAGGASQAVKAGGHHQISAVEAAAEGRPAEGLVNGLKTKHNSTCRLSRT